MIVVGIHAGADSMIAVGVGDGIHSMNQWWIHGVGRLNESMVDSWW